jgi:mannose-1-phosphate guanylyltransferase/phosphomannomutase
VRGLGNVDINPEVVVRLAMAYGTALPKGSFITVSRDTSRMARALKRALIAGVNLAGVNVEDIELATVPLTRFQVHNSMSQGGATVRLAPGDPDSVEIRFFDEDGRDLDPGLQRKIERLLYREDSRRAFGGEIGDIVFPPRALEFYTSALERIVDMDAIREQAYKIVVDYSFGAASIVMPGILTKLGAEVLATNPFASTASATAGDDARDTQVARIADLVRVSGSDIGFVIDPDGELATVVDDRGRILAPWQVLLATVSMLARVEPGARVAVPVSVTRRVEDLLGGGEAQVERTKLWGGALSEVAATTPVRLAWRPDGGCMWPEFLPACDAAATLLKLLELLGADGRSLSAVVDALPEVHLVHETVVTPWERKGTVMREVMERAGQAELSLVDGVRIVEDDRWVLVLPDPEEALTHVWAEAENDDDAEELAGRYCDQIRDVLA